MISLVAKSCGKISCRRLFLWAVWGPVKEWHHRSKPTDAGSTPMSVGLSAGYMLDAPDYNSRQCDVHMSTLLSFLQVDFVGSTEIVSDFCCRDDA